MCCEKRKAYLNDEDRQARKRASILNGRKKLAAIYKNDNPFLVVELRHAVGLEDVLLFDKGDNRARCNLGEGGHWRRWTQHA